MSRHHLDFVVSDFSLLCLTLGISELWRGYESLRMEITIVEPKGLLFDPPLNHHTKVTWFTLHPGSVVLMENLALINDWVN